MSHLIIIRGVTGTGKSTLAKSYVKSFGYSHYETDMWFHRHDGQYVFNYANLFNNHHQNCFLTVCQCLSLGKTVVVSNTFTTYKEMEQYVRYAVNNGHTIQVLTLTDEFGSVHDVPEETMVKMRDRFESNQQIWDKINEYKSLCIKEVC